MRLQTLGSIAFVALLIASCDGEPTPAGPEGLRSPVYLLTVHSDFCTEQVALDASNAVWTGRSCEREDEPFRRVGTATPAQRDAVHAAFAALPTPPPTLCRGFTSDGKRHNVLAVLDDSRTEWSPCTLDSEPANGPGKVAEPYEAARLALATFLAR